MRHERRGIEPARHDEVEHLRLLAERPRVRAHDPLLGLEEGVQVEAGELPRRCMPEEHGGTAFAEEGEGILQARGAADGVEDGIGLETRYGSRRLQCGIRPKALRQAQPIRHRIHHGDPGLRMERPEDEDMEEPHAAGAEDDHTRRTGARGGQARAVDAPEHARGRLEEDGGLIAHGVGHDPRRHPGSSLAHDQPLAEPPGVEEVDEEPGAFRLAAATAQLALAAGHVMRDDDPHPRPEAIEPCADLLHDTDHLVSQDLSGACRPARKLPDVGPAEPRRADPEEDLAGGRRLELALLEARASLPRADNVRGNLALSVNDEPIMPRPRHGNQEESASSNEEPAPGRRPVQIRLGSFVSDGTDPGRRMRPREGSARKDRLLGGLLEVTSARGVRGPDRVLLEALGGGLAGHVLVAGGREGLIAIAASRLHPDARVALFSMDAYEARRAREALAANGEPGVRVVLGADLPRDVRYDWVLIPIPRAGDAMLAQELISEAHDALAPGGKLLAACDNPKDRWVRERILETFGSVTIHARGKQGLVYIARRRPGHEPRRRDFRRSFRARLLGQELELETRPGVFSHGELDDGARAIAEATRVREDSQVIDLGCGSGALGIAAALAAPRGKALLVDSQPRSVEAARANALRNTAANAIVVLAEDLDFAAAGAFDLVLANPPYYADHRITEHFTREAFRALATGGEALVVTKAPGRAAEIARAIFGECSAEERRGYSIVRAVKKSRRSPDRGSGRSSRR